MFKKEKDFTVIVWCRMLGKSGGENPSTKGGLLKSPSNIAPLTLIDKTEKGESGKWVWWRLITHVRLEGQP